jgi:hypothetical protein
VRRLGRTKGEVVSGGKRTNGALPPFDVPDGKSLFRRPELVRASGKERLRSCRMAIAVLDLVTGQL